MDFSQILDSKSYDQAYQTVRYHITLSNKKAYVKILIDKWDNHVVPPLSAMEVQQSCNEFYRNHSDHEATFQLSYGDVSINTEKKYIHTFNVTESGVPGSFGLDPYSGRYQQVQFEGDLSFDKLFGYLIDFDRESKSINLYESLKKILERGDLIGFSEIQWQSILLQFSKKYLPGEYSSLCRYAGEDGTTLFKNMVKYINSDSESSS